jgi:putative FmdB family regulatory protein
MPTYEYRCEACRHECEAHQRMSDAPLVKCPACGKESLTKLISLSSFSLKGSGWYKTDFKRTDTKSTEKTESTDSSSPSASSETTTAVKTSSDAATSSEAA